MKPKDLINIPKLARSVARELPKSWQSVIETYFQPLTKKEVFHLNLIAVVVGTLAGYTATGFRHLIGLFQNLMLHDQFAWHLISPVDHVRGYWLFLIIPAGLMGSAMIIHYFAREAKGHGVPEVIEAVITRNGYIRKRIVAMKALASSLTIAAGGSVGREGPIVQIGSAMGSAIGQFMKLETRLIKTLVGCGAGGAIAATFNTPIAGVIFAIEIIVLELKTRSFIPLVISSVFATVISRHYLGNEPAFVVPEYRLHNPNELFLYLGLGILAGVLGVIVIKSVYGCEDFFEKLKIPFWSKSILGGVALAAVCVYYPQLLGVGYETVTEVLHQKSPLHFMALLIILKIFATSVTLASGGSGGVFAPSLFIGAMLGGAYGYLANHFFPDWTAGYGAYALVGMAAMFSATSRATFTAIVILFEMTLDYSIILPLMFVCVMADQVAWAIMKDSIYSLKLKRKGIQFVNEISVNVMAITSVTQIMTRDLHSATDRMSIREAANKLMQHGHSIFPVTDKNEKLVGVLNKDELYKMSLKHPKMPVKEIMGKVKSVVTTDESVMQAMSKIEKTRDPRVFVVDRNSGKLAGIVSPIDFVRLSSAQIEA